MNHLPCTTSALLLLLRLSLALKELPVSITLYAYQFARRILLANCLSLASRLLGNHDNNEWKMNEKGVSEVEAISPLLPVFLFSFSFSSGRSIGTRL